MHNPVNHPLRPVYRAVAAIAGIYLILFGLLGLVQGAADGERVLGQGTNPLWSVISLVVGAIVLGATVLGRNLDTEADKFAGWGLLVVGSYSLATSRTDVNVFDFTISTVNVNYLVGLVLIMCGLYAKTAPPAEAGAPRQVREGRVKEDALP
jgi:hypothetical protein